MIKIISVVGARPNFMKVAPLHRALERSGFESLIVHTGQHYDERMSEIFFRQLEMPEPGVFLGVGSGSHAEQTARIMVAFEQVVARERPDLVIVVGDVNSTVACALVAAKMHVALAHVEAGLRSGDRRMPEEINRLVTDSISDLLFVTEPSGMDNLAREGVAPEAVHFVGNLMIDSLVSFRAKARATGILEQLGLEEGRYALMTMHRPSNVDEEAPLREVVRIIEAVVSRHPLVFPMHPRTRGRLQQLGAYDRLAHLEGLTLLEPLGYLEFLRLMDGAAVVVTDSGGVQEETTYLQVPCLTVRENTERPITLTQGTNRLVALDATVIAEHVDEIAAGADRGTIPALWDGHAAGRIAGILERMYAPLTV